MLMFETLNEKIALEIKTIINIIFIVYQEHQIVSILMKIKIIFPFSIHSSV
jgi:hypothetical protein